MLGAAHDHHASEREVEGTALASQSATQADTAQRALSTLNTVLSDFSCSIFRLTLGDLKIETDAGIDLSRHPDWSHDRGLTASLLPCPRLTG